MNWLILGIQLSKSNKFMCVRAFVYVQYVYMYMYMCVRVCVCVCVCML